MTITVFDNLIGVCIDFGVSFEYNEIHMLVADDIDNPTWRLVITTGLIQTTPLKTITEWIVQAQEHHAGQNHQ